MGEGGEGCDTLFAGTGGAGELPTRLCVAAELELSDRSFHLVVDVHPRSRRGTGTGVGVLPCSLLYFVFGGPVRAYNV